MNVEGIINGETYLAPNPNYNSKTKKLGATPFILTTDPAFDITSNLVSNIIRSPMNEKIDTGFSAEQLAKYGLTPTNVDNNINDQLADAQSNWSKAFNSLGQTLISEVLLGTVKAIPDFIDAVTNEVIGGDGDYTNPVSEYLGNLKEQFDNNVAPIYVDSNRNTIATGGLTNFGWWASNLPSVMSSLTLLLPGEGVAKGLSLLGKAKLFNGKSIGNLTRSSVRALTGATKNKRFQDLNEFQKLLNADSNVKLVNTGLEVGLNAVTMRAIENYQEAQQTHKDTYLNSLSKLNNMKDEEYSDFIKRNEDKLKGVDTSDKDSVAKTIAKEAADTTFKMNWANAIFDVVQVAGLRNMFRGVANNLSSTSTRRMAREFTRWYGKTDAEKAALRAALPWKTKAKDFISDVAYGSKTVFLAEATEGIEEAWNYISQEEGNYVAKSMLKGDDGSTFNHRLFSDYLTSPELYDSAFWGVLGGVLFHVGGSALHRVSNKLTEKKEDVDTDSPYQWGQELENSENHRRIADIRLTESDLQAYQVVNKLIDDNKNPYQKKEDGSFSDFSDDVEKENARKRLWNETISKIALRSRDAGNLDLTKGLFESRELRNLFIEQELANSKNAESKKASVEAKVNADFDDAARIIQHADDVYSQEWFNASNLANEYAHKNRDYDKPLEYLNIIARENASKRLQLERFDEYIDLTDAKMRKEYESVKKAMNRGKTPDNQTNIDEYYDNIKTIVIADRLGKLRAERLSINRNKNLDDTHSKELRLEEIQQQINQLESELKPLELHWATAMSLRYIQNGDKILQLDTKEFTDYEEAIKTNDYSKIDRKIMDISEAALESIANLGINLHLDYDNLKRRMNKLLTNKNTFNSSDFRVLANTKADMEIQRLGLESTLIDSYEKFDYKNKVLDNVFNKARLDAIVQAKQDLKELYKTYGDVIDDMLDLKVDSTTYIAQRNTWRNRATEEDFNKYNKAVEVLNLAARHNRGLYGDLRREFKAIKANAAQSAGQTQSSSTSQNQNSTQSTTQPNSQSSQKTPQSIKPANKQIKENQTPIAPPTSHQNTFIRVNEDTNEIVESSTPTNIQLVATPNNDFEALIIADDKSILNNDTLFNQDGVNFLNPDTNVVVDSNPVLTYDSTNKKFTVKEKGTLKEVNKADISNETSTIPSTGELTDTNSKQVQREQKSPVTKPIKVPTDTSSELTSEENEAIKENKVRNDVRKYLQSQVMLNTEDGDMSLTDYINRAKKPKITGTNFNNIDFGSLGTSYNSENINDFDTIWGQSVDDLAFSLEIIGAPIGTDNLDASVANVTMNSTIADESGVIKFTIDLQNAIDNLINTYAKAMELEKHNDVYYINLENLARHINENTANSHNAKTIIDILTKYSDNAGNISYKLVDEANAKSGRIYDNYTKPSINEADENISQAKAQRVDILTILNNSEEDYSKLWNKIFESLEVGDELNYDIDGDTVVVKKDGIILGRMTKASFDGLYHQNVKGWNLSLDASGIDAASNVKNIFTSWLTTKGDNAIDAINNIAYKLAYDNLTSTQRKQLVEDFWTIIKKDNKLSKLLGKDVIDSYIDKYEPIELYVNIIKYKENYGPKYRTKQNEIINKTLTAYFNSLRTSYQQLDYLFNNKDVKIIVDRINQSDIEFGNEFNNFTEVIVGGYNSTMHKLGIGIDSSGNNIVSGEGIIYRSETDNGYTSVFIKTNSGRIYRVQARPIKVSDAKGDIDIIREEFRNTLNRLLRERKLAVDKEANFDDIVKLLKLMFYNGENYHSLFGNIVVSENDNGIFVGTSKDNGFWIHRHNQDGTPAMAISPIGKYAQEWSQKNPNSKYITYYDTTNAVRSTKDAVNSVMKVFDEAVFQVSKAHLKEDGVTNSSIDNTIGRMKNGKFVIELNGKEIISRESYSDFMIANNYVTVRLREAKDNPGSNYKRSNTRQASNKALYVRLETSSPIEEHVDNELPEVLSSNVDDVRDEIVEALANGANTTNILNIIVPETKNLTITDIFEELPVIYDDTIPGYAQWRSDGSNRTIAISSKLFGLSRNEFGRQIVHELIHDRIGKEGEEERKKKLKKLIPIYNEFIDILKTYDDSIQDALSKFLRINDTNRDKDHLFTHLNSKNIRDEEYDDLEDFLNYSLMNKTLYDALNTFSTKVDNNTRKKSIFEKIIEFIQDIFGFDKVKDDTLLKKELNLLNKVFAEPTSRTPRQRKTIKKNPSVIEQELPFTEPIEEKVNEIVPSEPEITEEYTDDALFGGETEFSIEDSTLSDRSIMSTRMLRDNVPSESVENINNAINNGDISISCK